MYCKPKVLPLFYFHILPHFHFYISTFPLLKYIKHNFEELFPAEKKTAQYILDRAKKENYDVTAPNVQSEDTVLDRSSLSYEDNIAQTKETVKMYRPLNISVEAELGHVGQDEDILPMVLVRSLVVIL